MEGLACDWNCSFSNTNSWHSIAVAIAVRNTIIMGKKNKSGINGLSKFAMNNKVVLAALGGAAVGVAIARLLGTEKAAEILKTVENKVREFGNKVTAGIENGAKNEQGVF